jgi:hypothetical protein
MADPLSGVASVIAIIQISSQILGVCKKYSSEAKNAREEIERLYDEVEAFREVSIRLRELAKSPAASRLPSVKSCLDSGEQCWRKLEKLKDSLSPTTGQKRMKRFGLRALKWPLQSGDVDKAIAMIERYKTTFNTALSLDQT